MGSRKEKAKLVSCDKNSLTEQQREKKNNNDNTDKKNIQHAMFLPPNAQLPPDLQIPLLQPACPLKYRA